jgi:hypothetical protein
VIFVIKGDNPSLPPLNLRGRRKKKGNPSLPPLNLRGGIKKEGNAVYPLLW